MADIDATKHRKHASSGASVNKDVDGDDTKRGRRTSWTRSLLEVCGVLRRRRLDIFQVSCSYFLLCVNQFYVVNLLVQRVSADSGTLVVVSDRQVLQMLRLPVDASSALLCLAFAGCHWHGPGRVPPGLLAAPPLPRDVVAAMDAGRSAKQLPFSAEDGWCAPCRRLKPPFANHCKICDRCSLWMDHHCSLVGVCVGFLNIRCFVLCLLYTGAHVMWFGLLLLASATLKTPALQEVPPVVLWVSFCLGYLGQTAKILLLILSDQAAVVEQHGAVESRSYGWPGIHRGKFTALAVEASAACRLAADRRIVRSVFEPHGDQLQGLLARRSRNVLDRLEFVFGESLSPRWLIPWVPRPGDPMQPPRYDAQICQAWAQLGEWMVDQSKASSRVAEIAAAF